MRPSYSNPEPPTHTWCEHYAFSTNCYALLAETDIALDPRQQINKRVVTTVC